MGLHPGNHAGPDNVYITMKSTVAVIILAALVATSCGGASAGGPAPSSPPTPNPYVVMVTRANDNGVVQARVGDKIQIALGTDYQWRLDPPDGVVLVHDIPINLLVRGTQAIWTAAAAGTSTITATGTVICPSGKPCIMLALLFRTTVVVSP